MEIKNRYSNVFYLNPKALFVGLDTTLLVNINSSWSLVAEWWNFRQGWGSVDCTVDLGFCPEGSGKVVGGAFPLQLSVTTYPVKGEVTAMSHPLARVAPSGQETGERLIQL